MTLKEKILEYAKNPVTTTARNSMGCSENWYDEFFSITNTFTIEEIAAMSEEELEHLYKLAYTIAENLY